MNKKRILIDEKVADDCTFVRKNKIRAVQIWSRFITLPYLLANEKFSIGSQSDCENLKCLPIPPLLQKPTTTLRSIQGTRLVIWDWLPHLTVFDFGWYIILPSLEPGARAN